MSAHAIGLLGIPIALVLLIFLAVRGWTLLLAAAAIAAAFAVFSVDALVRQAAVPPASNPIGS